MTAKTNLQHLASDPAALGRFLDEDWPALSHYERVEVIRQAGGLPAPQNLELLGGMFEKLDSPVFQAQILSGVDFSRAGGGVPGFLQSALRNLNSRIRANAIEAIGGARDETLREAVQRLLDDEDNRVRANACVYLWGYEPQRGAVEGVVRQMASSADPWVRASAVFAAGKILDPRFDELLLAALEDAYEPAAVAAVKALCARGHPALVGRAAAFLADERPSTSLWHAAVDAIQKLDGRGDALEEGVLHALGCTGDRELQDKLLTALSAQEGPAVAGRVLDFLEKLEVEFHLCQRLLEVVARNGLPEHCPRLQQLASGKLAMYADIIGRAGREISKRKRRWW